MNQSPYFLKLGVNSIIEKSTMETVMQYIIAFGVSRVVGTFIQEYRQILLNKVSNEVIIGFARDMMDYLMRLEYYVFKSNSETLANTFNKSLQALERLNRFVISNVMSNVVEVGVISVMLYSLLGVKYFFNTIFIYGIYMAATKYISRKRMKVISEKFKLELASEKRLFDIIYNIDTVKYFQQEKNETSNYAEHIKGVRQKDEQVISSLSFLNSVQGLIVTAGLVSNLLLGVHDCYLGVLTPGDLVMMQMILSQMMIPLNFMGMLMREVDETRVNLQYAIDMINDKEKAVKSSNMSISPPQQFHFHGGRIELKDLGFHFHNKPNTPGRNILRNINCTFEKGTINAIVGQSGNGKSTLFNLIYRLYDPSTGSIIVDGQDISTVELDSYRKV